MNIKKQIRVIFGIIIIIFIISGFFLFINSKSNDSYYDKKMKESENAAKNYATKMYAEEIPTEISGEDGWFYYFLITTIEQKQDITSNFFNGCNLKYEKLDNYKLRVYKDDNYTEVVREIDGFPTLSISKKESNGIKANDEITKIEKWFDEKQFNKKIDYEDMKDIDVYNFDKNTIINLYNSAVSKKFTKKVGPYLMDPCSIKKDELKDGYFWNVGILAFRGDIIALRIDIVYSDNIFLSDLIHNNKANQEQIKLYNQVKEIEKYIIKNQKIDILEEFPDYKNEKIMRLYRIISTFDDGYDEQW